MTYTQIATQMRINAERALRQTLGQDWPTDRIDAVVDKVMQNETYLRDAAYIMTRPVATYTGADLGAENSGK
jgi:hypothetical protein